ncbi:site-2 protease family protein [Peribacillus kribbensis]|uniref:site-2 protease family protein n=1 Tax=Peribacillus kribbensis TaxID=356658 RepID=UPI0004274205|nr:site-2 protease family protein [Peribacillus kribbensis]
MTEYWQLLLKIKVHPTFWLVLGIGVLTAQFTYLCMLFFVILIHELGHAAAAQYFSWRIKSIKLLPFGGELETEEHGNRPAREELVVALAGPLQHIWMALLAFGLYGGHMLEGGVFYSFLFMNTMILLFNLLPIWPLDGGKLLFTFLSLKSPFLIAHKNTIAASAITIGIGILLSLITVPNNLNIWIMVLFLLFSLFVEWKQRHYIFIRFLLERHYGRNPGFPALKPINADENDSLASVLGRFQRGCKHPVIVTKDGRERGVLDENELLHAYFTDKLTTARLGDLLYSY